MHQRRLLLWLPGFAAGLFFALTARGRGDEAATNAPTLAARLCAGYESLQSVSCQIRKVSEGGGNTVRMLSRVSYRKPLRQNVEIVAPTHRRVVVDGSKLYYYEDGRPHGFSRSIDQLTGPWADSVRNIPGTPIEHLHRLRGVPEQTLPGTAEFPVRRGYAAGPVYAVLSCDAAGRLVRIDVYTGADMKTLSASYRYDHFHDAGNGVWIPCLHEGELHLPDGNVAKETRYVDNLEVNVPIPDNLFQPSLFFKGVEFTDDFDATGKP